MESKTMTKRFATVSQASASEISQKEKTKDTDDYRQIIYNSKSQPQSPLQLSSFGFSLLSSLCYGRNKVSLTFGRFVVHYRSCS
jgi:hypothetical protein